MNRILIEFILMIFVGSIIGWFTNYLAIKLLFRPYNEINFFFFKIQGLIPKRKAEITQNIASTIEEELISISDITNRLKNTNISIEDIQKILDKIVNEKLKNKILNENPLFSMFLSDSLINKIKVYIAKIIYENKEEIILEIIKLVEEKIDLKKIMLEKMEDFSLEEAERIILKVAKKELKHIELIGGVLGGIIGAIQFFLVKLLSQI